MIYNVAFLLWISLPSSDIKNFKLTMDSVIALGFIIRANSLNAIKILANPLIAIDPTCHRHKKNPFNAI